MDIKKTLCVILACAAVGCALVSCGDSGESGEPASSTTQAATVDVGAVADRLKSEITFEDELIELDEAKISKILGVSKDVYNAGKVYVSSSGGTPEEIACFEATDETVAAEIKSQLEDRIESQKNTFTDYRPEQAPKLNSPVLKVSGKYVYMCISGDNAKAEEIIG